MPPATASVIIPQRNFLNFNAAIVHSITIAMLCSNSFSTSRVAAAVPSSTSSPSTSSANSSLDKDHKYNCCEKDSIDPKQEKPSQHNRGNVLTKRLALPSSSSKRMTDDEMAMVQKSIESRSQRSRRAGGITSKADINQFLKESSRRYRPATRLTSVASLESTASDLLAADRAQANGTWFELIRPVIYYFFILDVRYSHEFLTKFFLIASHNRAPQGGTAQFGGNTATPCRASA